MGEQQLGRIVNYGGYTISEWSKDLLLGMAGCGVCVITKVLGHVRLLYEAHNTLEECSHTRGDAPFTMVPLLQPRGLPFSWSSILSVNSTSPVLVSPPNLYRLHKPCIKPSSDPEVRLPHIRTCQITKGLSLRRDEIYFQ